MINLTVNGITERPLIGSFALSDNINARSTLNFSIDTENTITASMEVIATDDAGRIFGGTIDSFKKVYLQGLGTGNRRRYSISCIDFNQILDRRLIGETYEGETLLVILTDIVTNWLASDGITLGSVSLGDFVINQAVFNYIPVAEAFEYLRSVTGLNYNIDYNKELTFFLPADNVGDSFDDENCYSMELEETRQEYRNVQFIRAGDSTTSIQTNEVPSPKPDGQSKTFTLRFPVATKPLIYVNSSQINPTDIGINGLDQNKKWYWSKNSRQITQDDSETTLSDTATLSVSYQGLKPIIVRAENTTGIDERKALEGGTGYYENIITEKNIDDKAAATQLANGYLKKYGDIPNKIIISTWSKRNAGELIRVTSDQLEVNEDFLITDISVNLLSTGDPVYAITGASGEDLGGWVEFFRSLKPSEQLEVRENEILVKVQTSTENQGVQGSYTIKKFNALYPSNTLYPSETLYPNTTAIDTEVRND